MYSQSRIRNVELMLVTTATAGYLLASLTYDARRFDTMIRSAISDGVPTSKILKDLIHYDHTINHNLPVIVSGVLCLMGWYFFHYILFPKIQEKRFQIFEYTLSAIITGLVISGTFILLNTIEVISLKNQLGKITSLNDVIHFRKLFVLSDSIAFLTLICIYEVLAQFYYKLYEKLDSEPNGKMVNYLIISLICALAIAAVVSMRMVPFILHATDSRTVLAILLCLMFFYVLQEYYFQNIHFALHDDSLLNKYQSQFGTYLFLIAVACLMLWGIRTRIRTDISVSLLWVPVSLLIFPIGTANSRRKKLKETSELTQQISTKSAELSNLRAQINPHFLFNALNSLYATALIEKSDKTADGIQKLGDMMRFMLHENNHDRIPLSSEIAYLHNYIDIQRMRLDETQNMEIRVNIQDPAKEICIAPMLLNPFIENAFKHGISLLHPSWIYITLTQDADHIYFKVHNSLHIQAGNDPEKSNNGIGLENVERRLKLIYPGKYNLQIQKSAQDYFASLTLNY